MVVGFTLFIPKTTFFMQYGFKLFIVSFDCQPTLITKASNKKIIFSLSA